MNKYEIMYILRADLAEEAVNAQTAKYSKTVTDAKGAVEKLDKWGIKKLAYPIDFKTEGYYVLMAFTAPRNVPAELERQMKIAEEVIRYIVVKRDPKESVNPAPEKKPAKPAAPAAKPAPAAKADAPAAKEIPIEVKETVNAEPPKEVPAVNAEADAEVPEAAEAREASGAAENEAAKPEESIVNTEAENPEEPPKE